MERKRGILEMSEPNLFNSPTEEVKRLVEEVREAKETLRDVARALNQIETRMRRSFPSLFPKEVARSKPTESLSEQPTLTPEQAMQVYEELVGDAKKGEQQKVQNRLAQLAQADLNLLRRELGASIGKKKASRKVLESAILGRIRESVLLTKHADRGRIIEQASTSTDVRDPNDNKE